MESHAFTVNGRDRQRSAVASARPMARINRHRQISLVTLSGLDGAGKSSQGRLIQARLEDQGLRTTVAWLPIAFNPSVEAVRDSLKSASRRLRPARSSNGGAGADRAADADLARALVHRSAAARHAWVTVLAVANLVTNWRLAFTHSRTHDVLLLDRYSLDTAVRLAAWYGERGSVRFQTWLVRALSPRPVCSFLLDVPPETALARKRDKWNLEELTDQARMYRDRSDEFAVMRVDGERPPDQIADEIADEVLRRMGTDMARVKRRAALAGRARPFVEGLRRWQ
jgi:thymidylate kinase